MHHVGAAFPPGGKDCPDPVDRAGRGRDAEALVAAELERRGWRVVARNLRAGRGEIDIVALCAGVLRVVEVRSRASRSAGDPVESVGAAKRRMIARTLAAALARGLLPAHREVRFDVAAVVWPAGGRPEILLYENAFDAFDLL
jgi:putative endonuclease